MKHFVLIIEYTTGSCAFLTDNINLQKALQEFEEARLSKYNVDDKSSMIPEIISAKLFRLYYNKED